MTRNARTEMDQRDSIVPFPQVVRSSLPAPEEGADDAASKIARSIAVYTRLRKSDATSDVMQRIQLAKLITQLGPELQRDAEISRRQMLRDLGVTEIS